MKIELARKEELKEINEIAKQVHDLHVSWRPDIFKSTDEVISKERLEELIQNKGIFVAKEEQKIVGYAIVSIKERNNILGMYDRKVLDLETICVDETYRNKKIGTKLITYLINLGKQEKCTDFHLSVNEENQDAIRLYEKLGMKVKNINYSMKI